MSLWPALMNTLQELRTAVCLNPPLETAFAELLPVLFPWPPSQPLNQTRKWMMTRMMLDRGEGREESIAQRMAESQTGQRGELCHNFSFVFSPVEGRCSFKERPFQKNQLMRVRLFVVFGKLPNLCWCVIIRTICDTRLWITLHCVRAAAKHNASIA